MSFHDAEIQQLVTEIWSTMLGLDAQPCDAIDGINRIACTGSVKIHGARELTVFLSYSEQMARQAAAAMFEVSAEAATTDQLRDTLGELSNMVTGTFKSIFGGTCFIGLPVVIDFSSGLPQTSNHLILTEVCFCCDNEPVLITVMDRRSTVRTPARELVNAGT